jgi:hypothetical protein
MLKVQSVVVVKLARMVSGVNSVTQVNIVPSAMKQIVPV